MTLLDTIAGWVQRVLAVFAPETARALFIPAFLAVVVIGTALFVRKGLGPLCRLVAVLVRSAVTLCGALILLAEMGVATWYRQADTKPPTVVYTFGDAVASWITVIAERTRGMSAAATRVARVHLGVVVLVALAGFWLWNYRYCPDGATGCARPVAVWWAQLSA